MAPSEQEWSVDDLARRAGTTPAEDLPRITEALDRWRPLATEAVVAAMGHALQRRVDEVAAAEPGLDWELSGEA